MFVSRSTSLAVMFAGSGSGSVTSATAGIACTDGDATGCTAALPAGASVALTATPAASSIFVAWSGGCTGSAAACTTTIGSGLDTVTARFEPADRYFQIEGRLKCARDTLRGFPDDLEVANDPRRGDAQTSGVDDPGLSRLDLQQLREAQYRVQGRA